MGTRGTSLTSEATVEVAGYEFKDEVIEGNTNETILGAVTETVIGGMGVGVLGFWTDVGAALKTELFLGKIECNAWLLGINRFWQKHISYGNTSHVNYGITYESHGGGHWHASDQWAGLSAPTVQIVATETATIGGPVIGISAETSLNLNTGTTGPASVALNYQNASLLFGGNGFIANPVQTAISHSIQATLSSGSNCLLINPAGLYANSVLANINATVVNLGQPPVEDPDIAVMFETAEAEAQAAADAQQQLNAAGQAVAEWLETFLGGEDEELIGIPG